MQMALDGNAELCEEKMRPFPEQVEGAVGGDGRPEPQTSTALDDVNALKP